MSLIPQLLLHSLKPLIKKNSNKNHYICILILLELPRYIFNAFTVFLFYFFSFFLLQEIITFVKQPELLHHGVFRPSLSQLDIPDYVRQCLRSCWEEDPELRPDIRLVRMKLKELQAGL